MVSHFILWSTVYSAARVQFPLVGSLKEAHHYGRGPSPRTLDIIFSQFRK